MKLVPSKDQRALCPSLPLSISPPHQVGCNEETAVCTPGSRPSSDPGAAGASILDFQPPEPGEMYACEAPSFWYPVLVAQLTKTPGLPLRVW